MDDVMPPNVLVKRIRQLARETDDVEEILSTRGEEWGVSAALMQKARFHVSIAAKAAVLAAEAYPESPGRWGGFCLTRTGVKFYPLDPRPRDVVPEDIAHALAAKARFSGMTEQFYSVGAHSLRVAAMARVLARNEGMDEDKAYVYGLLHDAAEAYLADIPRPIKGAIPVWPEIEERVMRAVWERFGLDPIPYDLDVVVRDADNYALAIEAHALMEEPGRIWSDHHTPSDPDVADAGKIGVGEWWLGKRAVKEALIREMKCSVPHFDPLPAKTPEEMEEANERLKDTLGLEAPPPPAVRPSVGWMDELRVQGAGEDERVERNRRCLHGDGAAAGPGANG